MADSLTVPIALFVFRRPKTTARVFEAIRQARPQHLLIVADGPRPQVKGESERCTAVRAIVENVDWPCHIQHDFSSSNLGVRKRITSGLTWVFEQVEEAIVLEDDCLPHPTFFPFCQELLARYRNEPRVAMISGNNFQEGQPRGPASYYFSVFTHIWGWATWRRAWKWFDPHLSQWPYLRSSHFLEKWLDEPSSVLYWSKAFEFIRRRGELFDNWDYLWIYSCWANRGLSVLPNINLVTNIGFGEYATSGMLESPFGNLSVTDMPFPLVHPTTIQVDREADRFSQSKLFGMPDRRSELTKWKERAYELSPEFVRQLNRWFKRVIKI